MKILKLLEMRQNHDQFFTRSEVAETFAKWVKTHVDLSKIDRIIEPATGNKDLAKFFPGIEMYDIDPIHDDINTADYLQSEFDGDKEDILVVMNPPFGRYSKLAIQFFNHSAKFAKYIAQIVPKSFNRGNIMDRLDRRYKLVAFYDLPKNSFYLRSGPKYNVNCVAQIWELVDDYQRPNAVIHVGSIDGVEFVTPELANVAVQKNGSRIGRLVFDDIPNVSGSYHYLKASNAIIDRLKHINWKLYGKDSISVPTINRNDLLSAIQSPAILESET